MSRDLEHYRLKSLDLGRLTGVSLAVHAIPDAFLLMHCGVGCKHKATTQLSTHDMARNVVDRACWTEVGDRELIHGSAERIGPYIRSWAERLNPRLMVVSASSFLELTGEGFREEVEEAGRDLDCEVVWIPTGLGEGDLFAGYASVLAAVVDAISWSTTEVDATRVSVLGYPFDRYEGDHAGNLLQLKSLVRGLGLTLGPTLFSGVSFPDLAAAARSGVLVALPQAAPVHDRLQASIGRPLLPIDLPIGLAATRRWLEVVGQAAAVPASRVRALVARRHEETQRTLSVTRPRLSGLRVAVFAHTPLAAGLVGLLGNLGITPVLLGLRGLGDEAALRSNLARHDLALAADTPVLDQPSIHRVRADVEALLTAGALDGVIGSATELQAVSTLPAELLDQARPFGLETGFPCRDFHPLRPTPTLGYGGLVAWADRLLNAPGIRPVG